jgi:prolyl-tRNA editing enzyme YbaK/EbsC (Cys-tRNA(Pro) deacylase)
MAAKTVGIRDWHADRPAGHYGATVGSERGGDMVPEKISGHLKGSHIRFAVRPHPRAVTAQELAAAVHVSGHRVAKSVLIEAGRGADDGGVARRRRHRRRTTGHRAGGVLPCA